MNKLPEYDEKLVYELMDNKDNLSSFIKEKFEIVEKDKIEDERLRKALGRLKKEDFINGLWADNIFCAPMILSAFVDYISEYPRLEELSDKKVFEILQNASNEYGIDNIISYNLPSCGQYQIGWLKRDTYEWRIKVESFDCLQLNNTTRYIVNGFNNLGYGVKSDEQNDTEFRKKRYITLIHKTLLKNKQLKIEYNFQDFFKSLITASVSAQAFKVVRECEENDINTYYRELLKRNGYNIVDQTLRGESSTGKKSGELDLLVESNDGQPLSIIEAVKLNSVDKANIIKHIDKTFSYDSWGLKENILLVYSYSSNFFLFVEGYKSFIMTKSFKYDLYDVKTMQIDNNTEIKVIESIYDRSGTRRVLYHILVNFYA